MKKHLSFLFLISCFIAANSLFAQQVINVQAGLPDALFNAVSGANAGDVFVLADGGVYPNSAALPVSVPITIKTADGAAKKASVVLIADASGAYTDHLIDANASLTLKNIVLNGQQGTLQAWTNRGIHRGTINGGKIVVDGCDVSRVAHISEGGECDTLIVENSLFTGILTTAGGWVSPFDFQGDIVHYVKIQNNTIVLSTFGPFLGTGWGNYSPAERLTDSIIIDHNTMYNLSGAHGPTIMFNRTANVKITNNIVINGTFRPLEFFSDKYIDFPENSDDITPFLGIISHLGPKGLWLISVEMVDSAHTVIDMQANDITWTSDILNAWSTRGLQKPWIYSNETKSAIQDTSIAYFSEELNFTDAPATPMFAVNAIADTCEAGNADTAAYKGQTPYKGWAWYDQTTLQANYDLRTRAEMDMSYNTDSKSYTAGINGYPLGDLNWFPDLKAKWEQGIVLGVKKLEGTPVNFELSQNYPNPFNPTTNIKYSIPQSGFVTLKVYNLLGQEVATLVNQQQRAGEYNVDFNASNLASGVYMYRIQTENTSLTKKMILLR